MRKDKVFENENGRAVRMLGVPPEIAAQQQAEEALRRSEEQYRAIFEAVTVGLIITTPDGRVVEANPAACRMHGSSREEFLSLYEFVRVRRRGARRADDVPGRAASAGGAPRHHRAQARR
jgi:PAS domain-containing protein